MNHENEIPVMYRVYEDKVKYTDLSEKEARKLALIVAVNMEPMPECAVFINGIEIERGTLDLYFTPNTNQLKIDDPVIVWNMDEGEEDKVKAHFAGWSATGLIQVFRFGQTSWTNGGNQVSDYHFYSLPIDK